MWAGIDLMKRGDIYFVMLDPAFGHEQRGSRPVLIISPEAFNQVTQVPIVLPITTKGQFARMKGFAVELDECGTQTKGAIRCDQPRVLDISARNGRYCETVPDAIMEDVLARVITIFS